MKKVMELGRSMVEMLGVLAVIGVLSVLGLQGYKQAMLKHYANEAWESAMKFKTEVISYSLLNPGKESTYHSMGTGTSTSIVYLNRPDLLPSFADGSFGKFYVNYIPKNGNTQFRAIKINHLCSAILPGETTACESDSSVCRYQDRPDGRYFCYHASNVEW